MKVATLALIAITALGLVAVLVPDALLARYPASDVRIVGELPNDARREVERALGEMRLDLTSGADVKHELDARPWVHHTSVRVAWPNRLDVEVVPQRPVALWNSTEFLNEAGEVFASPYYDRKLPQLRGPPARAGDVMAQYRELARMLAATSLEIETLTLDDVGRWEFETDSGMRVLLGRSDTFARMRRLVTVMAGSDFAARDGDVLVIDARYAHGLAVRYAAAGAPGEELATHMNTKTEMSL